MEKRCKAGAQPVNNVTLSGNSVTYHSGCGSTFVLMKTEKELTDDILKLTMLIQSKFPELMKYITEMPVTIPDAADPEINTETLKGYYDSLDAVLKKYTVNHGTTTK
jgi:hypothetical protein